MGEPALITALASFSGSWLADIWYAAWLIVISSLVWSATRFEEMSSILRYSVSCIVRMIIVLLAALVLLMLIDWII